MASTVAVERGKRQKEYVGLRLKILEQYSLLELVRQVPAATQRNPAKRPPPKLGHWDPGSNGHSERVLTDFPELAPIVQRIESLLEQRRPSYIKARHTPLRRGDNFRRKNSGGKPREPRVQLNPGEWPPRYK